VTTVVFLITTLLFAWMALKPSSAPIKTSTVRRAAATTTEDKVRAVATRFATNLVTFNYNTVNADMDRIRADGTSGFPTQFQPAIRGTLDQLKSTITQRRSVSRGDVKGTAVTSLDDDTATVLVVVLQTFSNKDTKQTSSFHVLELTLINDSGWKVDKVDNPSTAATS
jgi:Mce-associated membrane protein